MYDPNFSDHHPRCAQHIDHTSKCTCERETTWDRAQRRALEASPLEPHTPVETPWNFVRRLVWRASTNNAKPGRIPTASVREQDAAASCKGCRHFVRRKVGGRSCYAWRGRVLQGYRSMCAAIARRQAAAGTDDTPPAYTLDAAVAGRQWDARYLRLTALGDCSVCSDHELAEVRQKADAAGLDVLGYTAHWAARGRNRPALQTLVLASTQTDTATRRASLAGWCVAQTVSAQRFADAMDAGHITTSGGQRLKLCDHQAAVLDVQHPPTCNQCGLCTVRNMRASGYDGVAFAEHGPTTHGRPWTRLVAAARAAVDAAGGAR